MNKYEVIGMFTAMDELCEAKQYESLHKVIKKTLAAAEGKSTLPVEEKKTRTKKEK